ncbi:MAG: hypothetical protein K0S46_518 [Moraxellaceae bacterium]|jgi:Spy/CpxP family protein refolding chaperone|nr:hypothetical protein [Moraxellaceae bacterium]
MKLSHALVLACALSTTAVAEDSDRKSGQKSDGAKHHMMKQSCDEMEDCITEGLNLNDDQRQKIRTIMENARQKRDALREETHQQVRQVLTPEQAKKLDAHRAEMMQYRAERMRDRADRMDDRARDMKKEQKQKQQDSQQQSR